MIKVKLVSSATNYTLASIACPYFKFYAGWDNAAMFNMLIDVFFRGQFIRYAFDSHELNFKYIPDTIVFNPRIHKMKKAVIRWYYEEDDEDILERGEYISAAFNIPVEFIAVSDISSVSDNFTRN